MTICSQSEADKVAATGFAEVYTPVKSYLDELDAFLRSVDKLDHATVARQLKAEGYDLSLIMDLDDADFNHLPVSGADKVRIKYRIKKLKK